MTYHERPRVVPALGLLLLAVLACNLPYLVSETATPEAATATVLVTEATSPAPSPDLPPALVESEPAPGGELPLKGPITLFFSQAMDRASVESALQGDPPLSGSFSWPDDATLAFSPDSPFIPQQEIVLSLGATARAANGLAILEPRALQFRSAGFLQLEQALPAPDAQDVDPTSAIVAAFNLPVVPLGGDLHSHPPAFSLDPAANGEGSWVNTSTYIFYPEPPLPGGTPFRVSVSPDLQSVNGGPIRTDSPEQPIEWTFTTAPPRLVSQSPPPDAPNVGLDTEFVLSFNQPMDPESVRANLDIWEEAGDSIPGELTWSDDQTVFTFLPERSLNRSTTYVIGLSGQTRARGGTPLGNDTVTTVTSVPPLAVVGSEPANRGTKNPRSSVTIFFSGPIQESNLENLISVDPTVAGLTAHRDFEGDILRIWAEFEPDTDYTLTLSRNLSDPWGGTLAAPHTLRFLTGSLSPQLLLTRAESQLVVPPAAPILALQTTNLPSVDITVEPLDLQSFIRLSGPNAYQELETFQPVNAERWTQPLDLPANRAETVALPLTRGGAGLTPGPYYVRLSSPLLAFQGEPYLVVATDVHLTFKLGPTDTLVWAVDLQQDQPKAGAPIKIYDDQGTVMAEGVTDPNGVFRATLSLPEDRSHAVYAVLAAPGDADFSVTKADWDNGVAGWDFGYLTDFKAPALKAYLYTDRPIYRPGHQVFYKGVLRQAFNARYSLPDEKTLSLTLIDPQGQEMASEDLPLSDFGTVDGQFILPENAKPGEYRVETPYGSVGFKVAEFRKPEIDLQVEFLDPAVQAGSELTARVQANFFFGAPAGDLPVQWSLTAMRDEFRLPGYQIGVIDERWLLPIWWFFPDFFGELIDSGEARTGPDGSLQLDLPTESDASRLSYQLEVTIKDESEFPVSARAEAIVHPAAQYAGIRADSWVGRAGEPIGFEVQAVDWDRRPLGGRSFRAEFQELVWVRQDPAEDDVFAVPTYTKQLTPISESALSTNEDGIGRVAFTPPEPGTYQIEIFGGGARTQAIVWVGGPGQPVWPSLPNQQLQLSSDREAYQPGESAQIFIPNPFGAGALALVTLERAAVMEHRMIELGGMAESLSLPITADAAPNVYVGVTLLGRNPAGEPDFRQGYLNLIVQPEEQVVRVRMSTRPKQAGPGDEIAVDLRVTDNQGLPVVGEFSLAVVDRATLALADPNAADIVPAFYGEQPLGVRTGNTFTAYAQRRAQARGGIGGGGGEPEVPSVREKFLDTALWIGDFVTGADGGAQLMIPLPDNLTTWQVDIRGLTADTRVGQVQTQVVTSKPLLIRPVTPRFLVVDDHVLMAAVVHNNTDGELTGQVALEAAGFLLDDPNQRTKQVVLPPGGRVRVEWWGTVQNAEIVDLVFNVQAGSLEDAARPAAGAIPVLAFTAPQTFGTAGTLVEGGERLELISLPRSYVAQGGGLSLEMAPSLAAAMLEALDALEHVRYESTEMTLSRFLPNLEAYNALQDLGLEAPGLEARLRRTVQVGMQRLAAGQNSDGGWGWWPAGRNVQERSDPYISAYVLFGLSRARTAGIVVPDTMIDRGVEYLQASLVEPGALQDTWELDRLAFQYFALSEAGVADVTGLEALYEIRDQLNPWAAAVLATSLEALSPGDPRVRTLVSDLEAMAVRSATGVHWELRRPTPQNMVTTLANTAIVLHTIAHRDPGSSLLPDAVRYLMAHRGATGNWASNYESAWSVLALTGAMRGTGELGGDFSYAASLNGDPLAQGPADAPPRLTPVQVSVPLIELLPDSPNSLQIQRGPGQGRLYYRAHLRVSRLIDDLEPLSRGLSVTRRYFPQTAGCPQTACEPIEASRVGDFVTVRLAVTLENDAYYLLVEDHLPAGAEILDLGLKTTRQTPTFQEEDTALFDGRRPFSDGWGWWFFNEPQIFDEQISWSANYVPAGTYELTYTLQMLQPGDYRVLPSRAWMAYFPEVHGSGAGTIFSIRP